MDTESLIVVLLTIATALIGYVGIIQKEKEFARTRPLIRVVMRPGLHEPEILIANVGAEPALGVCVSACGADSRRDVLPAAAEMVVAGAKGDVEVVVRFRGVSGREREAVRRFKATPDGPLYAGGHDEAFGFFKRWRLPR